MNKRELICAYISHLNGMKPDEVMKLSLEFQCWDSSSNKSVARAVNDIADWDLLGRTRQYWCNLHYNTPTWEHVHATLNFNPFYKQRKLP